MYTHIYQVTAFDHYYFIDFDENVTKKRRYISCMTVDTLAETRVT